MPPTVTAVKWLSWEAREAEVRLRAGRHEIKAFCHPCGLREGDTVDWVLNVFESRDVMRSDSIAEDFIPSSEGPYAYKVFGRVVDAKKRLVTVGEIRLTVDLPLPGDVQQGETVQFVCDRIDV